MFLPGIMELPGSFSGINISLKPQRGPLDNKRISLAIFIRLHASVFNEPLTSTSVSCVARDSNLLGDDTKGIFVREDISLQHFSAKPIRVFRPIQIFLSLKHFFLFVYNIRIFSLLSPGAKPEKNKNLNLSSGVRKLNFYLFNYRNISYNVHAL